MCVSKGATNEIAMSFFVRVSTSSSNNGKRKNPWYNLENWMVVHRVLRCTNRVAAKNEKQILRGKVVKHNLRAVNSMQDFKSGLKDRIFPL